jgi:hypothetical protein
MMQASYCHGGSDSGLIVSRRMEILWNSNEVSERDFRIDR